QHPLRAAWLEHGAGPGGGLAPDRIGAGGALRRVSHTVAVSGRIGDDAIQAGRGGLSARAHGAGAGRRAEPGGAETLWHLIVRSSAFRRCGNERAAMDRLMADYERLRVPFCPIVENWIVAPNIQKPVAPFLLQVPMHT